MPRRTFSLRFEKWAVAPGRWRPMMPLGSVSFGGILMSERSEMDRAAIGEIVDQVYATISGPAGPRDWSAQDQLFHSSGRQMRTGVDGNGSAWIKIMTPDEYRIDTTPFFAENDFYEVEIQRRIELLGNMAHVWSLYEARRSPDDESPERRGINSIQLFRDPERGWQVVSMIWDNERPGIKAEPF